MHGGEHWGWDNIGLPAVPDVGSGTSLNDAVRAHIAAARADLEMASFYDYLDFLAMAVVANENIDIPVPGETEEDKDGPEGERTPATRPSRDYPKLAKMAEDFLAAYPHSRKREAALLLRARALYCAQRPQLRVKEAAWPETGHFASGRIYVEDRQQPFNPGEIAAALDASDREFPKGRYANEIRNLRGLLAWRMHDWPRALDLTFQSLADRSDPVLQRDAALRLTNIFMDGLGDDEERARCLAAIKASPAASQKLRDFLPASPYPVRAMETWILAQFVGQCMRFAAHASGPGVTGIGDNAKLSSIAAPGVALSLKRNAAETSGGKLLTTVSGKITVPLIRTLTVLLAGAHQSSTWLKSPARKG